LIKQREIDVIFEHRVVRCDKVGTTLKAAIFELTPFDAVGCPPADAKRKGNLFVNASLFLDASYEGDLMARSGVSYRVGRESAEKLDEESAGIRKPVQLTPIDPFVIPGDRTSGLLDGMPPDHESGTVGSADERR
jgi:hypothetical protein